MSNGKPETTDLLARLRQHAGPAIMGCTCSSRLPNCPACDCGHAADEIERLLATIGSVQRSAFDAGYDAHRNGHERVPEYRRWSNT